ncbi:MAG: hypothetical protein EOO24_56150, partial [Comamonadaceae bacterium]
MKEVLHPACAQRIDREFLAWEDLRREVCAREADWAAAVTSTADRGRLATLQHELVELKRSLDELFHRAMALHVLLH